MNRTSAAIALTVLVFAVLLPFTLNIEIVFAQNNSYSIQNVDHQIEVMYSGNVVIRETITMTGQAASGFLIGFPYKYGSHILKGVAFDSTGSLPMNVGVQLGNRSGFYGFEITLPEQSPQTFTVIFLLSNDLLSATSSGYSLDFPAYPGFARDAASCNVTLSLPAGSSEVSVTKPDGDVNATNIIKDNLSAFAYSPAVSTFSLPDGYIQQMDVKSLNRVITIFPAGEIKASDSFRITNKSTKAAVTIQLDLPSDASDVVGKDEFGRTLGVSVTAKNGPITPAILTLQSSMGIGQSAKVKLEYSLPNTSSDQASRFAFNLDLFPVSNYFVEEASVQIIPPEGAHLVTPQLSELDSSVSVVRELFQENLEIKGAGVSYVDHEMPKETASLQVAYDYNPLWLSFRPTIWVWALSIVGSVIFAVWRRPKTATQKRIVPRLSAGLSPDNVRAFTEAYEERRNITHELRVLHARAQKGKIPRNYYKTQRKTLEKRLDGLSKNINQLKDTFRHAGGNYG
ncbi:MAG TPA: hypothetical protein VJ507_01945, partial [Candidatus Bathyarchaeia archaeon]|nr:hypothetical protein [Candidatus Bathyarchaeia archaeon]